MKFEKIFVILYMLINSFNLINGLFSITGSYSVVGYTSPCVALLFLIIAIYYVTKSNSRIKIAQYIFAISFSVVSVYILVMPMQTYGYIEGGTLAIKACGYAEDILFIMTIVSLIYSIIRMYLIKRKR